MKIRTLTAVLAVMCLAVCVPGSSQEIGYVEDFALAKDRTKALDALIPGTQDYYYYHCLHLQNQQKFADVENLLKEWIKRHNYTTQVHLILNRQALLTYGDSPEKTLARLRERIGLRFLHQRETLSKKPNLPTKLDPNLISRETLTKSAMSSYRNVDGFENAAFSWLIKQNLNADRRRHLLSRMLRPDHDGLPQLVVADLKHRGSGGFGSLKIHRQLVRDQLDECLRLMPELLNQTNFVNAYITKLHPSDDVDIRYDRGELRAYLDRLWNFVVKLGPVHNSLKAQTLYHQLVLDRAEGKYDKKKFMTYIQLPRRMAYVNPDLLKTIPQRHLVNLAANYKSITLLSPVSNDEPLLRSYFAQLFLEETSYMPYIKYVRDTYLKEVFAETKILNGLGDEQTWYALLSPQKLKNLRDRVDIDFAYTNPTQFSASSNIAVDVHVKNVKSLIVKVYEINTRNYFRQNNSEVNTNINLDGLVANQVQRKSLNASPLRRAKHRFEFPEIKSPGTYVIDFIGNGKSSRIVVRKGILRYLVRTSSAGHVFRVLDGANQHVKDATLLVAGREYAPDDKGQIAVPFSAKPGNTPVILARGNFAVLDHFDWQSEQYRLQVAFHVDRESLVAGKKAKVILRPALFVNGIPVSLNVLKEVQLQLRSTDLDGITSTKSVKDFKLAESRESTYEFQVPPRLGQIDFALTAKVRNLAQNKDVTVTAQSSVTLNGIDRTQHTEDVHFARTKEGFRLEVLGKTGEAKIDRPVTIYLKHKDFRREVGVALKSDENGLIDLGALTGITSIRAQGPTGVQHRWSIQGSRFNYPGSIHGSTGSKIEVPFFGKLSPATVSLFELRSGTYAKNRYEHLSAAGGMLAVDKLPAGDFELTLAEPGVRIYLRITEGKTQHGYVIGKSRQLELRNRQFLQIARIEYQEKQIRVHLKNANSQTRVHILANRFETRSPIYNQFAQINDASPIAVRPAASLSQYVAGRKLGDEYQYIIDRALAEKFPGNMLSRPTLLLNPWAVRKTETGRQTAASGENFDAKPAAKPRSSSRSNSKRKRVAQSTGFTNYDFLGSPAFVVLNLEPDENGVVTIERDALARFQQAHIVATDTLFTVHTPVSLPASVLVHRDLRLAKGLDPNTPHTEQKKVSVVRAGGAFAIRDVGSASYEVYDELGGVYRLLSTLKNDAKLREFQFILGWPKLKQEEKFELYSKHACHELHFFLYKKDRKFFDDVILPYLAHKKDKTFMDHWLLGNDLSEFLSPWKFAQLNTAERVLLAQRIRGELAHTKRLIDEQVALLPPNDQAWEKLFQTAVATSSLDSKRSMFRAPAPKQESLMLQGRGGRGRPGLSFAGPGGGGGGFGGGGGGRPANRPSAANGAVPAPPAVNKLKKEAEMRQQAGQEMLRRTRRGFANDRFKDDGALRSRARQLYQKLDKTQEWAENNYYKLPISQQNTTLVKANEFWQQYVSNPAETFLSSAFAKGNSNFTEIMFALALLDLPFEAKKHKTSFENGGMQLQAASPLIVVHQEINAAKKADANAPILVSQNFFRYGDRYRQVNNVKLDKFVKDEFLVQVVYGGQVVITNPTSTPRKLSVLLQIPKGAMPVLNGKQTRSVTVTLQPYNTTSQDYYFYFPVVGDFAHSPVHVAQDEQVIASAEPFKFHVVAEPSKIDDQSWDYISQHGTNDQVMQFLKDNNLQKLRLDKIAFRMKDKAFYATVVKFLRTKHTFNPTLWSYSVYHNDPATIREYLPHVAGFVNQCGPYLASELLTIDPVERKSYQHLEYKPLVNARAHQLGKRRQIVNPRFHGQYHALLNILAHKRTLDVDDRMSLVYYLLLQDRVGDAMKFFEGVKRDQLETKIQYDYLSAYLDFFDEDPDVAREVVGRYAKYPVLRWRQAFAQIAGQLAELDGKATDIADPMNRDQAQAKLAATESNLELGIVGREIRVDYQNLAEATVNFYEMDIELLFSRNPFVQQQSNQFSFIRPNGTQKLKLPGDKKQVKLQVPERFANKNVLVEVVGGGKTRSKTYFSNSLTVEMIENYGQVRVTRTSNSRPLPRVYVKVYARLKNGTVRFYKDGYTDLRGRLDYTSLNTNEIDQVERFSLLILSDKYGAVVREAAPPKR